MLGSRDVVGTVRKELKEDGKVVWEKMDSGNEIGEKGAEFVFHDSWILIKLQSSDSRRAKLGQIQGGGVAEGQPRFEKGGVAIIFYFLRVKNITFWSFYAKRLKNAYL